MPSLIKPSQMTRIRKTFQDGMETVQEFRDEDAVTIRRYPRNADPFDVVTFTPISVRLDANQAGDSPAPTVLTTETGTLKAFVADLTEPIHQSDRFEWQGRACTVSTSTIDKFGIYLEVPFTVTSRN